MTTRRRSLGDLFTAGVLGALVTVFLMGQTIQTDGQVEALGFSGDGSALTNVTADDSDLLDGLDSTAFAASAHTHQPADVVGMLPRRFYLDDAAASGSQALTACAPGFHMANLWEIVDFSALRYDASVSGAQDTSGYDLGTGPPRVVAGWVRTGSPSNVDFPYLGNNNCALWTSDDGSHFGTAAAHTANDLFSEPNVIPGTSWLIADINCGTAAPVWCIQDWPAGGDE